MVVLLVIAGGVAAVLLTRGQQAVGELERQDMTQAADAYRHRNLCIAAGYSWTAAASRTGNHCTT